MNEPQSPTPPEAGKTPRTSDHEWTARALTVWSVLPISDGVNSAKFHNDLCDGADSIRRLERELNESSALLELAGSQLEASAQDCIDEVGHREQIEKNCLQIHEEWSLATKKSDKLERDLTAAQSECRRLREALEDISTTAHCISLSGPATTPSLQDAWGKFDKISIMATKALNQPTP